jgi:hypothetical protein
MLICASLFFIFLRRVLVFWTFHPWSFVSQQKTTSHRRIFFF